MQRFLAFAFAGRLPCECFGSSAKLQSKTLSKKRESSGEQPAAESVAGGFNACREFVAQPSMAQKGSGIKKTSMRFSIWGSKKGHLKGRDPFSLSSLFFSLFFFSLNSPLSLKKPAAPHKMKSQDETMVELVEINGGEFETGEEAGEKFNGLEISIEERRAAQKAGYDSWDGGGIWKAVVILTVVLLLLALWTTLMVGLAINLTLTSCDQPVLSCAVCSMMVSEIHRHSLDLSLVGDTPESEQLFLHATTMQSLWQVPVGDYVNEAKAIVGFSFAQGPVEDGTPTPGGTNRALAWSVVSLLEEYESAGREKPQVMVQWEIAQVFLFCFFFIVVDLQRFLCRCCGRNMV